MRNLALLLLITFNVFICNAHKKTSASLSTDELLKRKSGIKTKQITSATFPIVAWVGLPEAFTNLAKYQGLKEAGFTHSYCPFSGLDAMEKGLNMAQKVGIKLFVACPELASNPEATVKRFMNHPALAGYYLSDEPSTNAFPAIAILIKRIEALDKKHICYVNLLPNYAEASSWGTKTYQDYLSAYLKQVPVKIISFDHYPVIGKTSQSIRPGFYLNLETISNEAKRYEKSFWAFALSVAFGPYPLPTLASLRLQVFTDLAYGAQGIQYFTYYTLTDPSNNFNNAPLDPKGKLTVSYGIVKQINKEIKSLSNIFMGARMVSVAHTGNNIPLGTTRLGTLPKPFKFLKINGLGAVVSVLKKAGKTYLVIVNRDIVSPINIEIACKSGVRRMLKNGTIALLNPRAVQKVGPGDISIYRWADTLN
jgi:hypothetical protein